MASISSLGVGSNLPLDQLLTDLTKNEKGRLTPITKQQSANSAKANRLWHIEKRIRKIPDGKYRVK
ncbi:flagellar hook associated protein 2 [Salmonella enterica subsp. enterica serovar Typhimurium str. DT104]|nr:flagellar hook associated protein 2 [Salmonella enterica subsp. enterica serovar Typhimurium str. DT104]